GEHDRQTGLVVAEGAEQAAQAGPEGLGLAGGGFSPFAAHGVLHLEDLVLGALRGRGSPLFAHTGSSTVIWASSISRDGSEPSSSSSWLPRPTIRPASSTRIWSAPLMVDVNGSTARVV